MLETKETDTGRRSASTIAQRCTVQNGSQGLHSNMPGKIFISYRRSDSAGHAGRVHDRLVRDLGRDLTFMDVDTVPLGSHFVKVVRDEVGKCQTLLAMIGPGWLDAPDGHSGRRLDNPDDLVRVEIATALERDIPVIPILLEGARIPNAEQLPDDLKELSLRNGLDVHHASFHSDMDKLIAALKQVLSKSDAPQPDPPAGPKPTKSSARTASPPAATTTAVAAAQSERRHLTIMCCDMVVSNAVGTRLDPEEQRDAASCFQVRCAAEIERCGGTVAQYVGDGVVAYFGYPTAHEDDAARAVRTGLAILDVTATLMPASCGVAQARIGIASGVVVVGDIVRSDARQGMAASGETTTLAARLPAVADPNTIVVSPETHRIVEALFEYRDLGRKSLPGIVEPVHVRQVIGTGNIPGRVPGPRSRDTPLVGRRLELDQLRAILDACAGSARGRAVCIRGEAGIGKTRLLEELMSVARRMGFACHTGLVLEFGMGAGHDAIRALARDILGLSSKSSPEVILGAAEEAFTRYLVRSEDAVFLNDLLDLPQPTELRAIYGAMDNDTRNAGTRRTMTRLVEMASRAQPRLLAVEDVHWADRFTLSHLAAVAATVTNCPAILVMTCRPEQDPLDRTWRAAAGATPLITTDLGPLHVDDATVLAESFLAEKTQLIRRCVERATGNPFFLEQLVRNSTELGDSTVPGSVQSLVQARLDRLDPEDKAAMQAASVLGQRFDRGALLHLLEERDYALERMLERLMIQTQGEEFLFSHALIREAIYGGLLKRRRRELHLRAAQWFAGRDETLRAEHLDRAEDPAAARAYLQAAQSQVAKYRYETARRSVERGLALASDRGDRLALACLHGEIMYDLGEMPAALEAFESALAAADTDVERCRALIGCAQVKRVTDDIDGAFADLKRAEEVTVRHGLKAEEARLRFLRGNLYFPRGDIDGCLREHGRSLELAREAGTPEHEVAALGGLGDAEYVRGRMISAHARLNECVELARRHGLGRIDVANSAQIAFTLQYFRPQREALAQALAAAAAAARVGHLRAQLNASVLPLVVLPILGEWDACSAAVEQALALVRRLQASRFEQNCLLAIGQVARAQGRNAEAVEVLLRAADTARRTAIGFHGPMIQSALAMALTEADERRAALTEGERLIRNGCVGHNQLHFYPGAIEASLELSDWDEAERYASALETFASAEPTPWSEFFVGRGRALAAVGRGRHDARTVAAMRALSEEGDRLGYSVAIRALRECLAHIAPA